MNIAIIPAWGISRRIPRKTIVDFCGKPLIYWTIKQALESELVDKVYASTEDREIAGIVRECGAEVIDRPLSLTQPDTPSEAVWDHAVKTITEQTDLVVGLQLTSPLRYAKDIDGAIKTLKDGGYDSVHSVCLEDDLFLWDVKAQPVTFWKYGRKLFKKFFRENGSIYVFKREVIERENLRYGRKIGFYPMEKWQSFEIDYPEDLEICEFFMRKKLIGQEVKKINGIRND